MIAYLHGHNPETGAHCWAWFTVGDFDDFVRAAALTSHVPRVVVWDVRRHTNP